MTPREKIDAAVEYLLSRKVGKSTAAPPLYRTLWALGVNIPPPHFQGFLGLSLVLGPPFGLFMWLYFWFQTGSPAMGAALGAFSGILFGLSMAGYFRFSASRLNLPTWSEFPGESPGRGEDANW